MKQNKQVYQDYLRQSTSRNSVEQLNQTLRPLQKHSRARLPKGKIKLLSVVVMIYVMLFSTIGYLLPLNKVNHLVVTGTKISDIREIVAAAGIEKWSIAKDVLNQREKIEKQVIEHNPLVESIKIVRPHWSELELHVFEHEVVAKVEYNRQVVPLLSDGEMLKFEFFEQHWSGSYLENVPLLIGFYQQAKLMEMTNILKKIDSNIVDQMVSIQMSQEVTKPNGISIKMKDGNTVQAVMNTLEKRIAYYPKMLQKIGQQRGVINLEVGAYFTPY